jgi:EEF1A lysine methyltransferase 1
MRPRKYQIIHGGIPHWLTKHSVLSNTTLDALKEFYADRDAHEKLFEDLKSASQEDAVQQSLTMDAFAEDWNESQFWVSWVLYQTSRLLTEWGQYSQETATVLAKQLLANSNGESTIAVISAPSVFVQLKNLLVCTARKFWCRTL